ncbi:hypothetical protein BGX27_001223 [Mortierella sp. AM989]|nr:hypothetical protein BGX27_001223 [Mortierella sp. AM989]
MDNPNYTNYNQQQQQQQGQNYAVHDITQQQHNPLRDTYGLPYSPSHQTRENEKADYIQNQQDNYLSQNDNIGNSYANTSQPSYYNEFDKDQPIQAQMQHRDTIHTNDNSPDVKLIKPKRERSKYLPCFPCIRSTCGRLTCCFCIIILLAIIIIVIVIFTVFKVPTAQYIGPASDPVFSFNQGNATLAMTMGANIEVNNPNPIGFNVDSIVVNIYYPGYSPSIGGGTVNHVNFPSKSTKTIVFPLTAAYDRHQDPGFTVVQSILTECGLTGTPEGKITINYDAKATMKIIGISFSYTLKGQSYTIDCPANIGEIASGIPAGIISGIGELIDIIKGA